MFTEHIIATQSGVVEQANAFFDPWESTAQDWRSCLELIEKISKISTEKRVLVWRGVTNASFALHSSLYRQLTSSRGIPPTEPQMVKAELKLLEAARENWRFGNLTALETLAHVQHYGGHTRLIDVTFNPLIALWFAVELNQDPYGKSSTESDGRLLAFDATKRSLKLDDFWGGHDLPWFGLQPKKWGMQLPSVWRPPSYNERIAAQNSAFLVGGVPSVMSGANAKYRKSPGNGQSSGTWTISEVRTATSVSLSMNVSSRTVQARATPTFTFRISASAKKEIRRVLATRFGITYSSLYPDLQGLARFGSRDL